MAQIDPFRRCRPAMLGRGLHPFQRMQAARRQIARFIRHKPVERGIRAVIGDVGGFAVGHHLGQFHRNPAHGVVLHNACIASLGHRDLGGKAVAIGVKRRLERLHRHCRGVQPKVARHRQRVFVDIGNGRRCLRRACIIGVFFRSQMGVPRRHRTGAGVPDPIHARKIDRLG